MFAGSTSTCEKKCLYMKEWYDSGCSRGRPTYSSYQMDVSLASRTFGYQITHHVKSDDILERDLASFVPLHEVLVNAFW